MSNNINKFFQRSDEGNGGGGGGAGGGLCMFVKLSASTSSSSSSSSSPRLGGFGMLPKGGLTYSNISF